MIKTLTQRQRLIVTGIARDRAEIAGRGWNDAGGSTYEVGTHRIAIRHAEGGWVAPNLRGWLGGQPTASEHVLASKDYRALEAAGWLVLDRGETGNRVRWLALTPAGEALAAVLADSVADLGSGI